MLPYDQVEYEEIGGSRQTEKALSAFIVGIVRNTDRTIFSQIYKTSRNSPMQDCDGITVDFDASRLDIEEMVNSLTDRQKTVFQMIYIEGQRPADIAHCLQISHSAVRQILKRIQDRLYVWTTAMGV